MKTNAKKISREKKKTQIYPVDFYDRKGYKVKWPQLEESRNKSKKKHLSR